MADRAPGLLSWFLCVPKGKVRNALRLQAPLPSAASRLRAYEGGIYQVLELPACSPRKARDSSPPLTDHALRSSSSLPPVRRTVLWATASDLQSVMQLLERWGRRRT